MLRKIVYMVFVIPALPLVAQAASIQPAPQNAPAPFCFQISKICIPAVPSSAAPSTAAVNSRVPDKRPPLDLQIPSEAMPGLLSKLNVRSTDDEYASADTVEVRALNPAYEPPVIPAGLFSVFWAVRHPTQAWRIFAPLPLQD